MFELKKKEIYEQRNSFEALHPNLKKPLTLGGFEIEKLRPDHLRIIREWSEISYLVFLEA